MYSTDQLRYLAFIQGSLAENVQPSSSSNSNSNNNNNNNNNNNDWDVDGDGASGHNLPSASHIEDISNQRQRAFAHQARASSSSSNNNNNSSNNNNGWDDTDGATGRNITASHAQGVMNQRNLAHQAPGPVISEGSDWNNRTWDDSAIVRNLKAQARLIPGPVISQNRVYGDDNDNDNDNHWDDNTSQVRDSQAQAQVPVSQGTLAHQAPPVYTNDDKDAETVANRHFAAAQFLASQVQGSLEPQNTVHGHSGEGNDNNDNSVTTTVKNLDYQPRFDWRSRSPSPNRKPGYGDNNNNNNSVTATFENLGYHPGFSHSSRSSSPIWEQGYANNSNNNNQGALIPGLDDESDGPSFGPNYNTEPRLTHAHSEPTVQSIDHEVDGLSVSQAHSSAAAEQTPFHRPILTAYLRDLNAILENASTQADFLTADSLAEMRCYATKVEFVDMSANLVLDFSPCFFDPMHRNNLVRNRPAYSRPNFPTMDRPWAAWPKRGEISPVKKDAVAVSMFAATGTGGSLTMKATHGDHYTTYNYSPTVPLGLGATPLQYARARQERVHETININRCIKRIEWPGHEVESLGTLMDLATTYSEYRTVASYLPETPTERQAELIKVHPDFLTTTWISPFYTNSAPPNLEFTSSQTPLECNGAVESRNPSTPYMIIPLRLGAEPCGDALAVGELRASVRAIVFKLLWDERSDAWLFPVLIITYYPSHARIIQIHATVNPSTDERYPNRNLGQLNIQYSPLFDLTEPLAQIGLLARYTFAMPVPWAWRFYG